MSVILNGRKSIVVLVVVMSFVVLLLLLAWHTNSADGELMIVKGRVSYHTFPHSFWGLEVDFDLRNPFRARKLQFDSLPHTFQHEGLPIICQCQFLEHVGKGDWQTIVHIVEIRKSEN